ncbi:Hypothetical predicted protein [Podarcis lilfordi]|uniref:Uncharacterized protein n=1 Tax=Podarcis lilfordi TaxID=74358 RepID=A0AA35PHY5_9SAUR|nr:Hypothetical predicted protein [Podarcis lilfordi]
MLLESIPSLPLQKSTNAKVLESRGKVMGFGFGWATLQGLLYFFTPPPACQNQNPRRSQNSAFLGKAGGNSGERGGREDPIPWGKLERSRRFFAPLEPPRYLVSCRSLSFRVGQERALRQGGACCSSLLPNCPVTWPLPVHLGQLDLCL